MKFKKALTTQFPDDAINVITPSPSTEEASGHVHVSLPSKQPSEEWIKTKSKIYGKETNRELTNWQSTVNETAYQVSKEDQSLLHNRASLKFRAEAKARETYVFKKRSGSRSIVEKDNDQQEAKRTKLNSMTTLTLQLESVKSQIVMTQKYISNSSGLSNFEACSKSHAELRNLLVQKNSLENTMADLASKNAKYQKRKNKKAPPQQVCHQKYLISEPCFQNGQRKARQRWLISPMLKKM